ncbi:DUF397 domain-containing protein [Actinomadura sp. KC216]|uniref:DUF397 domain-containing protein n=1 Tax=Actinomadura sp. KC216 TaxID=2530370 RepID=UPI0010528FB9|nr:DUF397 domain-containing protein [Actinomadura sp. KC216]TDB79759.1 DUF397 domain-containing protein [Actinomadura sp. KC216]
MNVQWRKSSHSGGVNDQHCVELGRLAHEVKVRDSKDPNGGHLTLTSDQFATLIAHIKRQP